MSGLAAHGGQGLAILGIVPPRRGLGAALALCSLVCLPRLPWLSHLDPTDWLPCIVSDRRLRNMSSLGPEWRRDGLSGGGWQDRSVHVGDMAWHGGKAWQTAS